MKRISIIGCCGSGKSTLSRNLHRLTGLPLVHLDQEFWNSGWHPSEKDEFRKRVQSICERDEWIMDGHYFSTMDDRLSRSDTVFYLDYPTQICLVRTIKRIFQGYGKDRSDCAKGCPERFDGEFLRYVINFRKNFRDRTIELLAKHRHLKIYQFNHPRQLLNYLRTDNFKQEL